MSDQPASGDYDSGGVPERLALIFQNASENVWFLKQQQWRVTNYALLAYAALFALRHYNAVEPTATDIRVLRLCLLAIAAFQLALLINLQFSLQKFRARIREIYKYYKPEERAALGLSIEPASFWQDPYIFLGLAAASVTALGVVWRFLN
jgi:hypothetical protein